MRDEEALSRLLDGDLPADEAQGLRERIAREPRLAEAWRAMQALPAELASLPDEAPPAALDARVLGVASPAPRPWRVWPAVAAAAAAVALVAVGWPEPRADLVLADGRQLVDGDARVLAGDVIVDVDGRALVTVEPPEGFARGSGAEDEMSTTTHLLAALAGAAVTVTVFEGSAVIHGGEEAAAPIVVPAGETRRVGEPPRETPREVERAVAAADPAVQARIAELEAENDRLRFESAVARGQVASIQGEPVPWPTDLPSAATPEGFERAVQELLASRDDLKLVEIDCGEFPCLATVEVLGDEQSAEDFVESVGGAIYGEEAQSMVGVQRSDDGTGPRTTATFGVLPREHATPDVSARARWRMDEAMHAHGDPG